MVNIAFDFFNVHFSSFSVVRAMFCEKLQHVLAQPSRDFVPCACWIARCEFWYRSRSPFGTSCVSDHSCCGAVRILISLVRHSGHFARVGLPWFWRSAHFSWFLEILAKRSFEFSARSFSAIFLRFLGRSCKDTGEILWRSPCAISCKSLWEDLSEILWKFSFWGPCVQFLKMPCAGACMKVLLGCS